jgi:hypothetical protein
MLCCENVQEVKVAVELKSSCLSASNLSRKSDAKWTVLFLWSSRNLLGTNFGSFEAQASSSGSSLAVMVIRAQQPFGSTIASGLSIHGTDAVSRGRFT